jgi:hypothetical protein
MFVDPYIIVQLTFILLTWRIWWTPNNASKWLMGFNSVFKELIKKNPTRCNNVSTFYYFIFIWSSTCFGWRTAHHQEPKTALVTSGFSYVEGCWTCIWWTLSGTVQLVEVVRHTVPDNVHQLHGQQPSTYEKTRGYRAVLGSWWWAVCRPKHVELHINME